ncbi:MAG: DUF3388 domain-containing protein [Halarsenatibacteraceae bacterium]
METLYMEYKIIKNRPGLLGDLASLLGLLQINIKTIASIENSYRGLLLEIEEPEVKERLLNALGAVKELEITGLRTPQLEDFLALKHGKKVSSRFHEDCYVFARQDLELLIDFISFYIVNNDEILIGIKGNPRIGKTETAIAAAVHSNKHWKLLSTTLLRQITLTSVPENILNSKTVFIIDAITTFRRASAEHVRFIRDFLNKPVLKIIEHPEFLIRESSITYKDFDLLVELTEDIDEVSNDKLDNYMHSINSFE